MLAADPRLKAALTDGTTSIPLLNELHQQILTTRDVNLLPVLLGKYLAIAASRGSTPLRSADGLQFSAFSAFSALRLQEATQMETRKAQTISNAAKAAQDILNNSINNCR
jgi:hypothetical protein